MFTDVLSARDASLVCLGGDRADGRRLSNRVCAVDGGGFVGGVVGGELL